MKQAVASLEELREFARTYEIARELPVRFDGRPYTRIPIHRDERIEVVVICFSEGQTSSLHDHEGSNCVVRLVQGKILENLFTDAGDGTFHFERNHCLVSGDVSGLEGRQIHQLVNLDRRGSVLLNFYSPPFQMT